MPQRLRALVKDGVFYTQNNARVRAPGGEYEVCRDCNGAVCFCHAMTDRQFILSFDSLQQYVAEGRILLRGGRIPDAA